jgi:hypothetical protein
MAGENAEAKERLRKLGIPLIHWYGRTKPKIPFVEGRRQTDCDPSSHIALAINSFVSHSRKLMTRQIFRMDDSKKSKI